MRYLYTLAIIWLTPFFTLRLFWKSRLNPGYRQRWLQRFGIFDTPPLQQSIWIHAASVGEVQATQQLVKQLQHHYRGQQIVFSTTTPTGAERVELLFGNDVIHFYFPYDIPFVINRWLNQVMPVKLIMMETEIWPNLLIACQERRIPAILANGRLSEKSLTGYLRFGQFAQQVFQSIRVVAVQSEDDAARFLQVGVSPGRMGITGSVKFDVSQPAIVREQAEAMRRLIGTGRPVWIAASTREGEEEAVLAAHSRVCEKIPQALVILVPRHPERFDKIAQLCEQRGFTIMRRSSNRICTTEHDVFLGDSMGELPMMYQVADVAFVGGSLVDTGGQNVLEPASFGLPVLFGPSMYNFAAISEMLLSEQAALRVDDADALAEQVVAWLSDASERARFGENARRLVEENRGATEKLVELIRQLDESD
jgi:3-deoxy-D-manno-octulosonic-acid transferase